MPRRLLMNKQDRDRPAIIAPPPLLMVVCVAAGLIAAHFWPLPMIHDAALARAVLCVALIVVAGALIFSGHREMVKNNEHPNPYKPTSTIVQNGIYGFTRNPLYISLLVNSACCRYRCERRVAVVIVCCFICSSPLWSCQSGGEIPLDKIRQQIR